MSLDMRRPLRASILLLGLLAGSGGCNNDSTAPTPVVLVLGPAGSLHDGADFQFHATINGSASDAVDWSVVEGATGGSISLTGDYTAPATPGTYHILAVTQSSPHGADTAAITVVPDVQIVSPAGAIAIGAQYQFHAVVDGTPSTAVDWKLQEGALAGTITAGGLYTASNASAIYHVIATSQTTPKSADTLAITVAAAASVVVAAPPTPLGPAGQFQFDATVNGVAHSTVVWSLQEGSAAGTITAAGLYTAGDSIGTFHVIATSNVYPVGADTVAVTVIPDPTPSFTAFPDSIEALTADTEAFSVTGAAGDSLVYQITGGTFVGTPAAAGGKFVTTDSQPYLIVSLQVSNAAGRSATIKDSVKVLSHLLKLPDQTYALAISNAGVIAAMQWLKDSVTFRTASDRGFLRNVSLPSTPIHGVFSGDGASFFVDVQSTNQVAKIDVATGAATTVGISSAAFNMALMESGTSLAVTTYDGRLYQMATADLAVQDSVELGASSNGAAARGGQLWVSTTTGWLYKIDPTTFDKVDSLYLAGRLQRVALNSDASTLYVADEDSARVDVVTTSDKSVSQIAIPGGNLPLSVALTPDGTELWVSSRTNGTIYKYDAVTLASHGSFFIGGVPRDIVFSSDGHIALIGAESFSVLIRR